MLLAMWTTVGRRTSLPVIMNKIPKRRPEKNTPKGFFVKGKCGRRKMKAWNKSNSKVLQ